MRRSFLCGFSLFISAIFVLACLPRATRASDLSYARIVRLSVVKGDVQVSRPSHPAWEAAAENMPIMQGMTIGTNDGYAEVQFEDGTTAWIAQNTLVQFTELALVDSGRVTKLTLGQGTMSVLTELRRGDSFSLVTSKETITTPKNALFRVDAFHDGASVSVLGGQVEVASAEGTQDLGKGKTLAYKSDLKGAAVRANPKADEWDRFVVSRAEQTQNESAQSLSYVNAPFSYGLADLSQYGAWNYFPGHGYGWQPSGMGSCWMPFMSGQWQFYSGFGWTWVSAEPWGWMPYHFGSWSYLPSTGWAWFPTNFGFWDPAPVNWYSAANQVGWWPAGSYDPSGLMFDEMASGCGGIPSMGLGGAQMMFTGGRPVGPTGAQPKKTLPPGSKLPTPPRLLLTAGRLGQGGPVRLFASEAEGKRAALVGIQPLENGKASSMFDPRVGAVGESRRMFAPTAANVAALRASVALRSEGLQSRVGMPAMKTISAVPAIATREGLRAMNAMPPSTSLPHRPAPVAFSRGNAGLSRGGRDFSGGAQATRTSAPARMSAPSSGAATHASSGSGGRPH